ncbi:MAG: ATP-binding protein [Chloroflexi bacterium]|nr:ATP-binding protein [Chloroflexota bacterium]
MTKKEQPTKINQTARDHATQIGQVQGDVHIHQTPTSSPPSQPEAETANEPQPPGKAHPLWPPRRSFDRREKVLTDFDHREKSASPFIIGRPLRPTEPIFGRDPAFRFIAGQLDKFSSVNIVGERRMGKTSLLNHLTGRQDVHLPPQPDHPDILLACLDLQANVTHQARFYGTALRELLDRLPPSRSAEARAFEDLRARLHATPEATYDQFQRALRQLRDPRGLCVRPVLIVDEFEHLLDPAIEKGFPFPDFFNAVRALITADLLAMIVASRLPLADYFRDPARPHALTSTFPSYFTPFTLHPLNTPSADALLLQPSDHPLTVQETALARRWAGGHPCHLQVAGQACYESKAADHPQKWARRRFEELENQSCMTGQPAHPRRRPNRLYRSVRRVLRRSVRATFLRFPIAIGRVAQLLGARLDDVAAWLIGAAIILALILILLRLATGADLLDIIKKGLGL